VNIVNSPLNGLILYNLFATVPISNVAPNKKPFGTASRMALIALKMMYINRNENCKELFMNL
jgi:hypothetical protein